MIVVNVIDAVVAGTEKFSEVAATKRERERERERRRGGDTGL